jgi:hypothetical protein
VHRGGQIFVTTATLERARDLAEVGEPVRVASEFSGVVVRLGRRSLEARLDSELAPLANVRLRLSYPDLGQTPGDLYGKAVGAGSRSGGLASIRLTSVDAADPKLIEMLVTC